MTIPYASIHYISSTATGTVVSSPSQFMENDIIISVVSTANQVISTANLASNGFYALPNLPTGQGTAGAAGGLNMFACWLRAARTRTYYNGAASYVAGIGSFSYCVKYGFAIRGCKTSGDPFTFSANQKITSATTSVTFENIETTTNNSIIMYVIAYDYDVPGTGQWYDQAAITDANNLSRIYRVYDWDTNTGVGGGLAVLIGEMATKGNTGQVAFTMNNSTTLQTYACVFESVDENAYTPEVFCYWS